MNKSKTFCIKFITIEMEYISMSFISNKCQYLSYLSLYEEKINTIRILLLYSITVQYCNTVQ